MQTRRTRIINRLRPPSGELLRRISTTQDTITVRDENFTFDSVYRSGTPQSEFFDNEVKPYVHEMFEGRSSLIVATGVTNSGKSYTLFGDSNQPGILRRALSYLLKNATHEFEIRLSIASIIKDRLETLLDDQADEVPILNIDAMLYHLETAIERRNKMSLAEKDPKLKCKIHFLINIRLYKIIDRDFTR